MRSRFVEMSYSSNDAALYSGLRARLTNVVTPDSFHAQIGLRKDNSSVSSMAN